MRLHDLIRTCYPSADLSDAPDIEVSGVREDSRLVKPGDLFIARPGTQDDGGKFIADATARGAVAVVTESADLIPPPLPRVVVDDAATAASVLAHRFHGNPSEKLKVLGITGTNGKTTVAYLLRHLLASVGKRCGMIGTVEVDDGATIRPTDMTTPPAPLVAEWMAAMVENGCDACVIETSSHALHQKRVAGVRFTAGAFTNLTGDHLDYHKTMDDYAAAKAMLFEQLPPEAVAVVNADDPAAGLMTTPCRARVVHFAMDAEAEWRASDIKASADGTRFTLASPRGSAEVSMKLVGRHNVQNALCAAAMVGETLSVSVVQLAAGLADAAGAPGRLQRVDAGQRFSIFVDYAHTDDALSNVLTALRPLTAGKLRVVFGCGGDRDRSKRPRMAAVASRLADAVYLTSDNPRTENPEAILAEIVAGLPGPPRLMEADRRAAIRAAVADAGDGDVVLIAGKGHEDYQIVGEVKMKFDDVEEARAAVAWASRP